MHFGIYVHNSGSTWLDVEARSLDSAASKALSTVTLPELDGLFIGLAASKSLASGVKRLKKRVRRDYTLKLISGGSEQYKCLVELDASVSDADLVANAESEAKLFAFVQWTVCRCIDMALTDFPHEQAALVKAAVQSASIPQDQRW